MKSKLLILIFSLTIGFGMGQSAEQEISSDQNSVNVFVTEKGKVMLYGEKSSLKKLERYLEESNKTQAKIGTVKPTPLKVFAAFEKVVELFESHNMKTNWYRDKEFSTPFFEEEK